MAATRRFETSATNVARMGVEGEHEVDLAQETVGMIQAKSAFSANLSVIGLAQDMWDSLLKIQDR